MCHFDEKENDKVKYRGSFRQTIFAMKTLARYNFTTVLTIQNHYDLDKNLLLNTFNQIFKEQEIYNADIQITTSYPNFEEEHLTKSSSKTDCMFGRVLTNDGVYSCPFLSGDYRGRVGASFKDYSTSLTAETDFCAVCSKSNNFMFTIG